MVARPLERVHRWTTQLRLSSIAANERRVNKGRRNSTHRIIDASTKSQSQIAKSPPKVGQRNVTKSREREQRGAYNNKMGGKQATQQLIEMGRLSDRTTTTEGAERMLHLKGCHGKRFWRWNAKITINQTIRIELMGNQQYCERIEIELETAVDKSVHKW